LITFLKVLHVRGHSESIADTLFNLRRDNLVGDMELDAIVRESGNQWLLCGEHRLIVTGLMVGIDVELGVQRQVVVGLMVVLVPLHMFEGRSDVH
jgi:hypothetical protein